MPTLCLMLALLLAFPLSLGAETGEKHKFFDKTNLLLHGANIASQAADWYSTEQGLKNPGVIEENRLGQTKRARIVLKSVGVVLPLTISYWFHREGFHKAERWIPVIVAVPSGIAATLNFRF